VDVPFTFVNTDTDGLPDIVEVKGFLDPFGNTRTSDPTIADTDGDGLTDDYEAGDKITDKNGHTFRKMRSDPLKVDSDDDGWDDAIEDDLGTNPLNADSDNDGIPDAEDDDPLVPVYKPSAFEIAIQLAREAHWTTLGFTYGEAGIKDGSYSSSVGDEAASSATYFVGWMGSSVLVFGDIRDVGESVVQKDPLGTGLNLAGFIPLFGDGEKVGKNSVKVVIKYPAKAVELFKGLVKYGTLDVVPEAHLPGIIDIYLPGIKDKLIKNGVTGKDLLYITKKGKLEEALGVIKRSDGKIIWLENGKLGKVASNGKDRGGLGWQHILFNHVYHGKTAEHFATVLGSRYSSEEEVFQLIMDGAKYGTDGGSPGNLYRIYNVPGTTKEIRIALKDDGSIITAYPVIKNQ